MYNELNEMHYPHFLRLKACLVIETLIMLIILFHTAPYPNAYIEDSKGIDYFLMMSDMWRIK